MKRNLYILCILVTLGSAAGTSAQVDTFRNTISVDNLIIKRSKLIIGPRMKGGGVRSYIFEIDNKTIGLVNYTWGSEPGTIPKFVSAYKWNSRNWKKIRNWNVKLTQSTVNERMTFCGDFQDLKDICVLYDMSKRQSQEKRPSLTSFEKKYGLIIKGLGGKDHMKYLKRSLIISGVKYLSYFIAFIFLLRFFFKRLARKFRS